MSIIGGKNYKEIEYYLYNYHKIRRDVKLKREAIIEEGRKNIDEHGGGISFHSDPTAGRAIRLCKDDIVKCEKWIECIESTIEKFRGTKKGHLLQKNYFDELSVKQICKELDIGRSTFFDWKNEVVLYMALLAAQKGLIKIK